MSNNTNTLFWVITGAVIIVAVFLLVNNSSYNTMTGISDKFSNITAEGGIESSLKQSLVLPGLEPEYIEASTCGTNRVYDSGFKIEIYDLYYLSNGGIYVRWFITNNNTMKMNKKLILKFYDCSTKKDLFEVRWGLENFEPKIRTNLTTSASGKVNNLQYYIKASVI